MCIGMANCRRTNWHLPLKAEFLYLHGGTEFQTVPAAGVAAVYIETPLVHAASLVCVQILWK